METHFQVTLMPIAFQTVSFHHRAHYYVRVSCKREKGVVGAVAVGQLMEGEPGRTVGGQVEQAALKTDRFQIDYNDQNVHFGIALQLRIAHPPPPAPQQVAFRFELIKSQSAILKGNEVVQLSQPNDSLVSWQELMLNLNDEVVETSINSCPYRKIVFPTSEYISYLDLAYLVCKIRPAGEQRKVDRTNGQKICCVGQKKPTRVTIEQSLRNFYVRHIDERLAVYRNLSAKVKHVVGQYHRIRQQVPTFRHLSNVTAEFEVSYVDEPIYDLDYVSIYHNLHNQIDGESNQSLKKPKEDIGRPFTVRQILCEYYQCSTNEIWGNIIEEGFQIETNIRWLSERWTQLQLVLAPHTASTILHNEFKRVHFHITCSEQLIGRLEKNLNRGDLSIPNELFEKYKLGMRLDMGKLRNISYTENKQPLLWVLNQPGEAKQLQADSTLTVFLHGYRGNEFDLSKYKSYLTILLKFSHFYAVRNLNLDEIADSHLARLGETAAKEINDYLSKNPNIKHVNVVGFSMGGVIARAMLPYLRSHREKFHLLLTLASPHMGMNQLRSCLVRAGLLYMRKVTQVESIAELCDAEGEQLQNLATCDCIKWFHKVVLIGSEDDNYIPAHSALMSYNGDQPGLLSLATELNKRLQGRVVRCLARLSYSQSVWDVISQRRAHIAFLEDDSFIRYLVVKFAAQFGRPL